jgi:hypothetical protein
MIFTAMAIWVLPRFAKMTSRGEDPSRLYDVTRNFLLGSTVFALVFFHFILPSIMRFWIGADMYDQMRGYLRSFVGFELIFVHSIMPFTYLNASGKDRLATGLTLMYCGLCYIFMIGALWISRNPVVMISGMTLSLCITMPVVNMVVYRCMQRQYGLKKALSEMSPVYSAIILVYWQGNSWLYILSAVLVLLLLWKFYLSNLVNESIWQQQPNR